MVGTNRWTVGTCPALISPFFLTFYSSLFISPALSPFFPLSFLLTYPTLSSFLISPALSSLLSLPFLPYFPDPFFLIFPSQFFHLPFLILPFFPSLSFFFPFPFSSLLPLYPCSTSAPSWVLADLRYFLFLLNEGWMRIMGGACIYSVSKLASPLFIFNKGTERQFLIYPFL